MPMSIDAMLDMERQEVLALLENKANQNSSTSPERTRAASPYESSRSPVRSMLDIEEEPSASDDKGRRSPQPTQAPVRSMLDLDGPPQAPQIPAVRRSMLDVGPSTGRSSSQNSQGRRSQPTSPTMAHASLYKGPSASSSRLHPRSSSDAGFKPVDFGPRRSLGSGLNDRTSEYQFSGFLPQSSSAFSLGKRPSQTKRQSGGGTSLADALRGQDFSGLQLPGDRGRKTSGSKLGNNNHQSKSPHNRWSSRSRSPATFASLLGPNKAMLDDGQVVDIKSAYRRLSDANLAFSSGSLSQLPLRKKSDETGDGRLVKDYLGPDGEHLESSDEDEPSSSDDEDRGRNKAPRSLNPDAQRDRASNGAGRSTLSLLAAADEESK